MSDTSDASPIERRCFLRHCLGGLTGTALAGVAAAAAVRGLKGRETVWQIDPGKCVHCGKCATECVVQPSAVKCLHHFPMCGYCNLCFGYFEPDAPELSAGAENQLCPVGAISRRFVEEPYYEYTLDEELCIGCAICVRHCNAFGNGSLYLQIRQDLCVNCNECAIARACPGDAIRRIPADRPYTPRSGDEA